MIGRLLGGYTMTKVKSSIILVVYSPIASLLIISSMMPGGKTVIFYITETGFFISIIFASAFSLATTNLGKSTNQSSSFLIMGISGGFFLLLLFGFVADLFSLRTSLIIVVIPLLFSSLYGFCIKFLLKKNNEKQLCYTIRVIKHLLKL
jgi:FHS family L-fucose permease-like MFS transporter